MNANTDYKEILDAGEQQPFQWRRIDRKLSNVASVFQKIVADDGKNHVSTEWQCMLYRKGQEMWVAKVLCVTAAAAAAVKLNFFAWLHVHRMLLKPD